MLKKYCLDKGKEWDEGLLFLLFAICEVRQESLGFSPMELVFGHEGRGPIKMLKEKFLSPSSEMNVLDYVIKRREHLHRAVRITRESFS